MSDNVVRNRLFKRITSLCLDKDDLRKVLATLQVRANEAAEKEYILLSLKNPDNLDQIRKELNECAILKIGIKGNRNEDLFGTIDDVFNSVSFPESIESLYINSDLHYRSIYKYNPQNSFKLFIDFTKPKVFDFSFAPNEKTPNESEFGVEGSDNTWVNGVFHEIDSFFKFKQSRFSKVHRGSIYDFLVWFMGIPFGFAMCYNFINLKLDVFKHHTFFENIILTYIFFLSLFILRISFHYFRWVYPMIEYKSKNNRSIIHQAALASISLGIIGKIIYDLFKFLL